MIERVEVYIHSKSSDSSFRWHLGNSILAHLQLDVRSHLLGYSNKGQNTSAGISLKTCFLLYYKIETYKVPKCLLFYKHDYVSFFVFFNSISITLYFWPVNHLERVIRNILTMKAGTREKWEISLEDYLNGREVV